MFEFFLDKNIKNGITLKKIECQKTAGLKSFTQQKRFKCMVCPKSFGYKQVLITHMRLHTGEKPFSCTVCKKRFSDRSNLNKHTRTHNGPNHPFRCQSCRKTFTLLSHG